MVSNETILAALDVPGYDVLEAITYAGVLPTSTHARPTKFVCADGRTYWAKGRAQRGLVAELIAGRLGALVGASPIARIINVPPQALPASGEADHLQGIIVGIEDVPERSIQRICRHFLRGGILIPIRLTLHPAPA